MDVNWREIYHAHIEGEARKMKFQILPKVLPWASDFQENVDLTVEWLLREGKDEEFRFSVEPVIVPATNGWYTVEEEPGKYIHCCYPQDLLKFRGQYEALREQVMDESVESMGMLITRAESARKLLWSAWNCLGGDGKREEPVHNPVSEEDGNRLFVPAMNPSDWPRVWNYRCRLCCEDLPKSLKLWQKMQHGKLKEMA